MFPHTVTLIQKQPDKDAYSHQVIKGVLFQNTSTSTIKKHGVAVDYTASLVIPITEKTEKPHISVGDFVLRGSQALPENISVRELQKEYKPLRVVMCDLHDYGELKHWSVILE